MTTPQTPSPDERTNALLQAHYVALEALFEALDAEFEMPTWRVPTNVLIKLDAARETAAALGAYLPEPTPEQGMTPEEAQVAYEEGLLSVAEYDQRVLEAAHNAEPFQRCVAVGCPEPAFCSIGEFWYCDTHAKEPLPF